MISFAAPPPCDCGHKLLGARLSTTCEGARFVSGVCSRCGLLTVQRVHLIRDAAASDVADMPASDRPSARLPTGRYDSPDAKASDVFV